MTFFEFFFFFLSFKIIITNDLMNDNHRINGNEIKANVVYVVIHIQFGHQDHMKRVEFMLVILP